MWEGVSGLVRRLLLRLGIFSFRGGICDPLFREFCGLDEDGWFLVVLRK